MTGVRLVTTDATFAAALDMGVAHALLRRVAEGAAPATARLRRPAPAMAFGRLDRLSENFGAAADAARARGYAPIVRLGGGHAAAYDDGSVILDLVEPAPVLGELHARFAATTDLIAQALRAVGAEVVVGELPGEYCAGRWSLHLRDGPKVAGLAQRVIRGASLVTAVIVVEHGAAIRGVLEDVYAALDLTWDPATAGACDDGVAGLRADDVHAALADVLRAHRAVTDVPVDDATLVLARELASAHAV